MMQVNEGEIRTRGLEAIREWVSKDDRYISMIGECEIIKDAVSILRRRTIGEGEEGEKEGEEGNGKECGEEEGVSVREKNGILGIVLEMVEGGGWRGSYSELEEVVNRLEEEGKKRWKGEEGEERRKRRRDGMEGDGKISTLCWMGDREEEENVRRRKRKRWRND